MIEDDGRIHVTCEYCSRVSKSGRRSRFRLPGRGARRTGAGGLGLGRAGGRARAGRPGAGRGGGRRRPSRPGGVGRIAHGLAWAGGTLALRWGSVGGFCFLGLRATANLASDRATRWLKGAPEAVRRGDRWWCSAGRRGALGPAHRCGSGQGRLDGQTRPAARRQGAACGPARSAVGPPPVRRRVRVQARPRRQTVPARPRAWALGPSRRGAIRAPVRRAAAPVVPGRGAPPR